MKTLLTIDSTLYLKRLVRELNATQDGFYAPVATFNVRCNRARFAIRCKVAQIEVRSPACYPQWFIPSSNTFTDAYGRDIVASRKP